MRTILIPTSKLIKYIPSEPDGGVIPGKVLRCDWPSISRNDSYSFTLNYYALSEKSAQMASCILDEELDLKPDSNRINWTMPLPFTGSILYDDGIAFELKSGSKPSWDMVRKWCVIPDPFDALGQHKLSSFVRCGLIHIACCAPLGLDHFWNLNLAVVKKDANLISPSVIESREPLTFGPPCRHNVGWLIPWASKSKGINIAWLEDKEMDQFVSDAQPLPKV